MRFSGFIAWWLWRTVYLAKLPGFTKKLRVAIRWSSELLFPREIEQLVTLRDVERMEKLGAALRAKRGDPERSQVAVGVVQYCDQQKVGQQKESLSTLAAVPAGITIRSRPGRNHDA
jgi:hypothetical protein